MRFLGPLCVGVLPPTALAAKPPTPLHDLHFARIDGAEVARFTSRTQPDAAARVARPEELLDAAPPRP